MGSSAHSGKQAFYIQHYTSTETNYKLILLPLSKQEYAESNDINLYNGLAAIAIHPRHQHQFLFPKIHTRLGVQDSSFNLAFSYT